MLRKSSKAAFIRRASVSLAVLFVLCGAYDAQTPGSATTADYGCPELTNGSGSVLYGRQAAGAWNLDGLNLTFESIGQSWSVRSGGSYLEPTSAATVMPLADDGVLGPFALPFVFSYPGGAGSTTSIDINPNGRVYFEAGTNSFGGGWTAPQILPNFLTETPSVCALGVDLNSYGGGRLTFETRTAGANSVALITWESVPEYPDAGSNTFQCQLWSTGDVVVCLVETNGFSSASEALIGISAGGGSVDPGASHIEAPLSLSFDGDLVIGGSFTFGVRGVPQTSTLAILGFGLGTPTVPTLLSPLGAPAGCTLWIDQIIWQEQMTLDPPNASMTMNIGHLPGSVGFMAHCQAFVVDPGQGGSFPLLASDRGVLTLGAPPELTFIVDGANSFYGSPAEGGFFRLVSGAGATHADIVDVKLSMVGEPQYFDVEGNAGIDLQGHFDDGNGRSHSSGNAFYGSDTTTGLIYGGQQQPPSCDGTGSTGWIGSAAVGGSSTRFRVLEFEFADFQAGETFSFDCDTDGGDYMAGAHAVTITVIFANATSVSQTTQFVSNERAESVLIP